MHRFLLLGAALIASTYTLVAQTKLDMSLNHIVQTQKTVQQASAPDRSQNNHVTAIKTLDDCSEQVASRQVSVIARLQTPGALPITSLRTLGVEVIDCIGSFAFLSVPVESLEALAELDEFTAIEQNRISHLHNDRSRQAEHVIEMQDPEKAQTAGMDQTYTGRGVVVGVFDSGIDFNHNNFRHPETHKTRIKKALVFEGEDEDEKGKVYTDPDEIDKLTTDNTEGSHGTHTSSTAAGSYAGKYLDKDGNVAYEQIQGVAPEADLVLAGAPVLLDNYLMQSLNEMDRTATELDQPLVVNLSLGRNGDWLDGKSTVCQFFDEFTDYGNKPGRIVCVSAGNEGDEKFTIRGELNEGNGYTLSSFFPSSGVDSNGREKIMPNIWAYSDDDTPFTMQLDIYSKSDFSLVDTYTSDELIRLGLLSYNTYTNHDGRFMGDLDFKGKFIHTANCYCAVTLKSEKTCGIRLFASIYGSYGSKHCTLEDHGQPGFTAGDGALSINTLACTNSVLSVGAWTSHNKFRCYNNGYYYSYDETFAGKTGDICAFSSYIQADANGYARPDIAAPGLSIVSGYNSYDTYSWGEDVSVEVCGKAAEEYLPGHTSLCGAMCGTSMACPNVVGVIALWMQKNPNLTVNQIRKIFKDTASQDDYTAANPVRFGAGKVNALEGAQSFRSDPIFYQKKYDLNGDGTLSISDITKLVNYILGK